METFVLILGYVTLGTIVLYSGAWLLVKTYGIFFDSIHESIESNVRWLERHDKEIKELGTTNDLLRNRINSVQEDLINYINIQNTKGKGKRK